MAERVPESKKPMQEWVQQIQPQILQGISGSVESS